MVNKRPKPEEYSYEIASEGCVLEKRTNCLHDVRFGS